jgi:nucleotide-binding universal stress UspA family protein
MTQSSTSTIVAVVAEDGRFDHVWRRAMELARDRGARLVLFDVDAAASPLESPLPTDWSAHGEEEQFGDALNLSDLEAAGRGEIADRVREARQAGVEAFGWLPDSDDPDELRDYATHQGASLIVVPSGSGFDEELDVPTEVVLETGGRA